jgi:hypothetical protein
LSWAIAAAADNLTFAQVKSLLCFSFLPMPLPRAGRRPIYLSNMFRFMSFPKKKQPVAVPIVDQTSTDTGFDKPNQRIFHKSFSRKKNVNRSKLLQSAHLASACSLPSHPAAGLAAAWPVVPCRGRVAAPDSPSWPEGWRARKRGVWY